MALTCISQRSSSQMALLGCVFNARVGTNRMLVISDPKTFVEGEGGLNIRFESVVGNAIACGFCLKEDSSPSTEEAESFKLMGMSRLPESAKEGDVTVKSNGVVRKTFKFDAV